MTYKEFLALLEKWNIYIFLGLLGAILFLLFVLLLFLNFKKNRKIRIIEIKIRDHEREINSLKYEFSLTEKKQQIENDSFINNIDDEILEMPKKGNASKTKQAQDIIDLQSEYKVFKKRLNNIKKGAKNEQNK